MTKAQKLDYIFKAIIKAYPDKKLVFNDGSPDSLIMIIGEAPGADEEKQGKPFVGRAGKLLNATLQALGYKREDFYVSNIVKYRPQDELGKTLTPTSNEIEKFRPAIIKEIEVVKPKAIVVLGRIAMTGMGIEGTITANHGKIMEKSVGSCQCKLLVIYHPAAILRNPNWEPTFRENLAKLKNLL